MKNVAEWRRRGLIWLIVVALVVGLYYGFRPRPVLVDMGAVTRGPMRVAHGEPVGVRLVQGARPVHLLRRHRRRSSASVPASSLRD